MHFTNHVDFPLVYYKYCASTTYFSYGNEKKMFIFTNFTDDRLNVMMRPDEKYKSMVSAFRMSELQSLMSFAGKSKAGKKSELQVTRNNNQQY